ncbi:hypothetical protein ASPSYDRAFT_561120 [Aspergillus sydowii CBS 593.65]|uniref:Uncharacterized protein n=1 Tax=Aspergillus sydowii CBS 593.65 TaxID=1036612 RepID=A0A1L9T054_9EURO|nr:uncharacterized protein ASPSYDRAFT_561120 [Aspergillus sydowii CBS 593.65]OJJ52842.1 hypothetical protein ASPSYDRAFT_561120 [Aspergillus sydowii CBS 593.65]
MTLNKCWQRVTVNLVAYLRLCNTEPRSCRIGKTLLSPLTLPLISAYNPPLYRKVYSAALFLNNSACWLFDSGYHTVPHHGQLPGSSSHPLSAPNTADFDVKVLLSSSNDLNGHPLKMGEQSRELHCSSIIISSRSRIRSLLLLMGAGGVLGGVKALYTVYISEKCAMTYLHLVVELYNGSCEAWYWYTTSGTLGNISACQSKWIIGQLRFRMIWYNVI